MEQKKKWNNHMYRKPSGRKRKNNGVPKLNLIPILDAVFIFIFFLLMSANFIKLFEIGSDVPIISSAPPPPSEKIPLALTLQIDASKIDILTGVPSVKVQTILKNNLGKYNLLELHNFLIQLKKSHPTEDTVIFEPLIDISYEDLIEIMDNVRIIRNTDEPLFRKNKNGLSEKVDSLFGQIIFGNLTS